MIQQTPASEIKEQVPPVAGISVSPLVAVVILNWNGRSFLEKFLPSVIASVYPNKRVIVADNASTDDSLDFLSSHYPNVEVLKNISNEGFAKGYNTTLKKVEADYYVLLNSDVEVSKYWISPVIDLMESDESIAACQPKILAYSSPHNFEYAGACGGWIDYLGYPFARGRIFETCEEDKGQYDRAEPCFWASGAALFIRKKVFHEMHGFDEYFFAHQEEIDLCWRIQLAGYKIFVQPASVVYHVGGGTLPQGNSRKTFYNFRNNLVMMAKNLGRGEALWKIPLRMLLDHASAWRGLFSGDSGYFVAVIKAQFHFWGWLLFNRKRSVFPVEKKGRPNGLFNGSVAWAYFIRKRTRFSEIVGNK